MNTLIFTCLISFIINVISLSDQNYVKVLSPEGIVLQNPYQLKTYLSSQILDGISSTLMIVNSGETNVVLFDEIFRLGTGAIDNGLKLCVNKDQIIINPSFADFSSDNFFGSKALEFSCQLSPNLCILVSGRDFDSDRACFNQCCRRIVKFACDSYGSKKPLHLIITVDTSDSNFLEQGSFSSELKDYISSIEKDFLKSSSQSVLKVSVMFVDLKSSNSLTALQLNLKEAISPSSDPSIENFVKEFYSKWSEVSADVPKPIYKKEERQSLFIIESAYTLGLSQIESSISSWQKRVGSGGKLIGKFADRVRSLHKNVLQVYKSRTSGTLTLRERHRRSLELTETLKSAASNLFNQQVSIIQSSIRNKLKETLLAIPDYSKEIELQTLRSLLFEFKSSISDLEIDEFGLKLTPTLISEFSTLLQEMCAELPEMPQSKLDAVRRLDAQSKSQKKKKGPSGINAALNLVAMLRPSGFGNLQGFVNYGTNLFGLPLELLMGFQNDGDSPDILGDDREYPLLRLQPKVHFDIDT